MMKASFASPSGCRLILSRRSTTRVSSSSKSSESASPKNSGERVPGAWRAWTVRRVVRFEDIARFVDGLGEILAQLLRRVGAFQARACRVCEVLEDWPRARRRLWRFFDLV